MNHKKDFLKELENYNYGENLYTKFRDFCQSATYALALPFYPELAAQKLKEFNFGEDKKKLKAFDNCFEILTDALETSHTDFLGEFFGENNLTNDRAGQFFTPYNVSLMSAKMTLHDIDRELQEKPLITIGEPACGSGGMIIACREVFLEKKLNPSTQMYVELTDIDELCFYMAYIQISLYGIAAKVIHGDTLRMTQYKNLFTPVYFLNNFQFRLMFLDLKEVLTEVKTEEPPEVTIPEIKIYSEEEQLVLF